MSKSTLNEYKIIYFEISNVVTNGDNITAEQRIEIEQLAQELVAICSIIYTSGKLMALFFVIE